uniref:IX n=1 Tax=Bat mastadenovirus TaxID=740971 RepID=A0A894JCJ6_9ADEN|nr:IX [Bat mastadenovirus]
MDPLQKGIVNTCFLSTRIPSWAGARQNVDGSNLTGGEVPSNVAEPRRPVEGGEALNDADLIPAAVDGIIENLKEQVSGIKNTVTALQADLNTLKQTVERVAVGAVPSV